MTLQLCSGAVLPAIGFGTYAPGKFDTDEAIIDAIKSAVRHGYRHLDCAALYRNEIAVGSALKDLIVEDTVKREDVFITSKLWNTCHRPDLVQPSLQKTLEDIGLEYVDLYLMHNPQGYKEGGEFFPTDPETGKLLYSDVDYMDTWRAFEDLVDEGYAKDIGVSNFNSEQLQRVLDTARIKPSNLQIECNIYLSNRELVEYAQKRGVTVTTYRPLGGTPSGEGDEKRLVDDPVLKEIAAVKKKTPAQVALRYIIERGMSVVPKSIHHDRVLENFEIFDFKLSESEMARLYTLNVNERHVWNNIAQDHKYYPFNLAF